MLILGTDVFGRSDADSLFSLCKQVSATAAPAPGWTTFNVLQQKAGQVAALDLGYRTTPVKGK
jgi:hypothetical protein